MTFTQWFEGIKKMAPSGQHFMLSVKRFSFNTETKFEIWSAETGTLTANSPEALMESYRSALSGGQSPADEIKLS